MIRLSVDEQESARYSQLRGVEYRVLGVIDSKLTEKRQVDEFGEELSDFLETNPGVNICVDLAKVEFISSTAVGRLKNAHERLRMRGNRALGLRNVRPEIYAVLEITKYHRFLDIDEASREAYRAHTEIAAAG